MDALLQLMSCFLNAIMYMILIYYFLPFKLQFKEITILFTILSTNMFLINKVGNYGVIFLLISVSIYLMFIRKNRFINIMSFVISYLFIVIFDQFFSLLWNVFVCPISTLLKNTIYYILYVISAIVVLLIICPFIGKYYHLLITAMYALRPLVEHNMTDSIACEINDRIYSEPADRLGKVAAAIWPWKCKDALFRYNEGADTRLNQDGMAYDADSGDGTVYEYNYSRQNEGGCVMFCLQEAIHNTFRNNVSFDDLGGTISPAENPDALIKENTFYVRKGVPFVRKNMDGGNYTLVDNQIFEL